MAFMSWSGRRNQRVADGGMLSPHSAVIQGLVHHHTRHDVNSLTDQMTKIKFILAEAHSGVRVLVFQRTRQSYRQRVLKANLRDRRDGDDRYSNFASKPAYVHERARFSAGLSKYTGTSGMEVNIVRETFPLAQPSGGFRCLCALDIDVPLRPRI